MTKTKDFAKLVADVPAKSPVWVVPLLVAVVGYGLGFTLAPDIDGHVEQARWAGFFGAAAQVTATLLLALALEARFLSRTNVFARPTVALLTVGYVALGVIAAGVGLSPSLPSGEYYRQAFALTVAGGVGALVSVVLIGNWALLSEYEDRNQETLEQIAKRLAEMEGR